MTSSSQSLQNEGVDRLDSETFAIYLEVPGSKVVLLQAFFEHYEGVGVVRTLDIRRSLVCILTTPAMLDEALRVLDAAHEELGWRFAPLPAAEDRERYRGYFKK